MTTPRRPEHPARLVVSVHDVAPASADATAAWLTELDARGIPATLLVIPGPWRGESLCLSTSFQHLLRARRDRGDELVQHGWRHATGADAIGWRSFTARAAARGAGEFAALSYGSAVLRLRAGRDVLWAAGLPTDSFTAPGWLHSPGTIHALRTLGFSYTTTHTGVLELASGRQLRGLALSHRPGGAGERTAARMLRLGARAGLRSGGLIRIALHPADLDRPGLAETNLAAIEEVVAGGARPTTYRDLLAGRSLAAAG